MQPRTLAGVGVEVGSMLRRLLVRLSSWEQDSEGWERRTLPLLPRAPVHLNTGAGALALVVGGAADSPF